MIGFNALVGVQLNLALAHLESLPKTAEREAFGVELATVMGECEHDRLDCVFVVAQPTELWHPYHASMVLTALLAAHLIAPPLSDLRERISDLRERAESVLPPTGEHVERPVVVRLHLEAKTTQPEAK